MRNKLLLTVLVLQHLTMAKAKNSSSSSMGLSSSVPMVDAAYEPSYFSLVVGQDIKDQDLSDMRNFVIMGYPPRLQVLFTSNKTMDYQFDSADVVMVVLGEDSEQRIEIAVKMSQDATRIILQTSKKIEANIDGLLETISCKSLTRLSIILDNGNGSFTLRETKSGRLSPAGCGSVTDCKQGSVRGSTLVVTHDVWYPLFFVREDGQFAGLMHDLLEAVARRLDLKVEFVNNTEPGVWGSIGSASDPLQVSGMLGMVHRGEADMAAAGFGTSPERMAVSECSVNVFSMRFVLFAKRYQGSKINPQNYLWEFDRYIWAGIAITSALLSIGLTFAMHLDQKKKKKNVLPNGFFAATVMLRALVNKGTAGLNLKTKSAKALLMILFTFSTVLMISYRSCLNAFLAVVIPAEGVKNFEDVLEKTAGLTYWPGGKTDSLMKASEEGTAAGKLYVQFQEDPKAHLSDYKQGFENVIEHNYVLLAASDAVMANPLYSCELAPVKNFLFTQSPLTFLMQKGSRFAKTFNREILNLINQVQESMNSFFNITVKTYHPFRE